MRVDPADPRKCKQPECAGTSLGEDAKGRELYHTHLEEDGTCASCPARKVRDPINITQCLLQTCPNPARYYYKDNGICAECPDFEQITTSA